MYQQSGEKWKWIGIIIIVSIIGLFIWQNQDKGSEEILLAPVEMEEGQLQKQDKVLEEEDEPQIGVHIAGAVKEAGVYFLPRQSRVIDLVKRAGGVTRKADLNRVNLAQPLMDGQKVVIPEQIKKGQQQGMVRAARSSNGKININTGSKEDLMKLSGVGPGKAGAIIDYRKSQGPFRKLEDLVKVRGIGEKTFEKLKDKITLY